MMAKYFVFLFLLFTVYLSGCEDSSIDNKPSNKLQKQKPPKTLVKDELKTPKIENRKITTHQSKIKKKQTKAVKEPQQIEKVFDKPALDLSVPIKKQQSINIENTSNSKQSGYLPDFFTEKNDQINRRLQINGKMIEKEEEEVEKQRSVDGVGIAIKLMH